MVRVMKRALFLCTGNYYRSRWAELRFAHHAQRAGLLGWDADSAGLRVDVQQRWNVGSMSARLRPALEAAGLAGASGVARMPRDVTERDLASAAVVVAMLEREHRPMVLERFPAWVDRVVYWQIDDVVPTAEYDPPALIDAELSAWVPTLKGMRDAAERS